jgi:hypothetical protein
MAWAIIDSLTSPTGGVFTFASLTLTGYKVVRVVCSGVTVTTDATDPAITFYVGGVEQTSNYRWVGKSGSTSAANNTDSASAQASLLLVSNDANWDVGNASTKSFGAIITIDDPTSTATHKRAIIETWSVGPTGNALTACQAGMLENTGAINGLKIKGTSNLTAGNVRILGLT